MISRFVSIPLLSCVLLLGVIASCQKERPPITAPRYMEPVASLYDTSQKPFYHGVASGDPLSDRVIIWTRVTPEKESVTHVSVKWEVSENENFNNIVASDTTSALSENDFTVKVDVINLRPGKFYFYRFSTSDKISPVGRTKTASQISDSLRFAVVSCNNWEFGYFNAYENIAEKEVDAVVHLGDYIYEYAVGKYGDTTIGRKHIPSHEVVSLEDYRTRYSQYNLDVSLQHARQRHPFIAIWDDHEVANNVYTEGAQNHQEEEGDFNTRKEAAKKAYYEWMPIRESQEKIYRSFSFGKLVDLIMLDERLEGRTKPADSLTASDFNDDKRSVLGARQLEWMHDQLKNSHATWKIIGNQVMFSDLNTSSLWKGISKNLDAWDGYPAEKKKIIDWIRSNRISNLILVTGDTHASWAIEAATDISKTYNPKTAKGAFAIELGTTSISSGNGDEYKGTSKDTVLFYEKGVLKANPHVKFVNNRDHGYLLISLKQNEVRSEWWYVKTLRTRDKSEFLAKVFHTKVGTNALR